MDAEDPPGGDPSLKPISKEDLLRHLEAALGVALQVLQFTREHPKPYEVVLGLGIAMKRICRQYGWSPRDIHDLLDQVEPRPL